MTSHSVKKPRATAKDLGLKQYFTGKPCRHGHVAARSVINGLCIECARLRANVRYHSRQGDEEFIRKIRIRQAGFRSERTARNEAAKKEASLANGGKTVIWRKEARTEGLSRYFTGRPCRKGHRAERLVVDGACVECSALKTLRYWAENPGRIRARTKEWAIRNRDRLLDKAITWREANRERVASFRRNRRARERSAEGGHTGEDIKALIISQDSVCACGCGESVAVRYEVDHKIPISRGGSNWPDNLQVMTPSCNRSKNDKTMEEWMACKTGIKAATLLRMKNG